MGGLEGDGKEMETVGEGEVHEGAKGKGRGTGRAERGGRGETGQSDGHWRLREVRWEDYSWGVKSRDGLLSGRDRERQMRGKKRGKNDRLAKKSEMIKGLWQQREG